MQEIQFIPHYSISPNSLTLYNLPDRSTYHAKENKGWENLEDNTNHYGELSNHAQKRLKKKLNYLMYLTDNKEVQGKQIIAKQQNYTTQYQKSKVYQNPIQYKLTFITLTLPSKQIHTDNEIKSKCLNQFLIELKKNHSVSRYIWKAEKQENNNIHFHIIADKFVKWQDIREIWNRIINKLGYVDNYEKNMREFYKDGFKISKHKKDKRTENQQKKAYDNLVYNNFRNPNSTDIHALYKVKNIQAYISKYLAKGVTKTARIEQMNQIELLLTQFEESNKNLIFNQLHTKSDTVEYKELSLKIQNNSKNIEDYKKQLSELKSQGIEGKIWGCSQVLSKCENYTDVGDTGCIPDFEIIPTIATYIHTHEVGDQKIHTFFFDINQTPNLKLMFDEHLRVLLE
ncbi:rolling circle replication-associated protein [Flavobacterium psychrophilum]